MIVGKFAIIFDFLRFFDLEVRPSIHKHHCNSPSNSIVRHQIDFGTFLHSEHRPTLKRSKTKSIPSLFVFFFGRRRKSQFYEYLYVLVDCRIADLRLILLTNLGSRRIRIDEERKLEYNKIYSMRVQTD